MRAKFGVLEQTRSLHLPAKFYLTFFLLSASGGQNHNFGQILPFWGGLLYRPFLPMRAKFGELQQTPGVRLRAEFHLDRFTLSPSVGEKPQFLSFFGLRHLVVSPIDSTLRKLNTDAQKTFPYPSVSKSSLYSNAFMAKSGAQSDVQKRDEQTDTKLNVFGRPSGG